MSQYGMRIGTEDGLAFSSTVLGAAGAALGQQVGNPKILLLGLVVAAISKALPSLEANPWSKETVEDWLLFLAAFFGALGAGMQADLTFSNPNFLIYALLIGVLGKTIPSIIMGPKKLEDILPAVIAMFALLGSLPYGSQYISFGVFFCFLAKTLATSSSSMKSSG